MTRQTKLSVTPSHVTFVYEAGHSHAIPFTVQNVGESTASVRVQLPSTQYLSLRRLPQGSGTLTKQLPVSRLAPGMKIGFELVFDALGLTIAVDHTTDLWVQYDSGKVVVPVHCCAPKCECVLEGSLDFGLITCGSGTDPSRQVYVVNEGGKAGEWALSLGEGSIPLQLKPERGSLGPGERQAVTATLQDISIGQYIGSVALSSDAGKNPKRYNCNAQAVTATFQTVGQSGQTLLEVDFGTVLNHDRRTQIVYLVNSSAHNITCGIELGSTATMKPVAPGVESEVPEGDNPYASFVAAARVRAEALAAASKAPFSVQPAHVNIPAFQKVPVKVIFTPVHMSSRKGFSSRMETGTDLHNYTAVIEVHGETKRVVRLPLKGKCAYNVAEVSAVSLQFQDDSRAQICQQQFCVKNRAKSLSLRYQIQQLPPFFHVHPKQGAIPVGASSALDVMYKPKALGAHTGKVQLLIQTEHGRVVEQHAIHVHGVCDNAQSVIPWKTIPVPNRPGKLALQKAQNKRVPLVPGLKYQNSKLKAPEDDFIVPNIDDMYNEDPGLGKEDDTLWLATNNMPATYTPTKEFSPEFMKRVPVHQEMLSKENGGNRPLEKAEIQAIRAGPPVVHFGTMATCAENTQYFCITNTLQHPIHALVDAKMHEHLIGSSNVSQAIPAGQSAVFSICLRSTSAKSYRHSVEFILNGLHFLHFDIHADVIDPMISVSNSELEFALSTSDWLSHVDKVVMLENPNKFPCSFQWQILSPSPFTVTPMTGSMPAASSLDTVVRWTQDKDETGKQEAQLVLRINGGVTSRTISVRGNPPEGLVKWKGSKLHVGSVPVGLPVTATTFMLNKGLADSVVRVVSSPHMECTPESSLIRGGDMIPMSICFVPQDAGTFKSLITAEQRGGKVITLPVLAEAIMPQVSIEQREFNFGVVYFGANKKLPLTVINSGPVPAQVIFDFTEHPLFSLLLASEQWENLEEYTESPLQVKGTPVESSSVDFATKPSAEGGNRYCLDMKAGRSFTLAFTVTASMITSEAFPLPMSLPREKGANGTVPEILVLADCLETRLTITPALVDLGSCIIPSASSVRSAYEYKITITNQQDSVLVWSCTAPTTEIMEGCKGVFTISELGRDLQPLESCTIKVLFIPKAPTKYSATIEFSAKLPHEDSPLPLMTMELKGEGRYPQLLFDRPVAFLPAVPVGFTSQTQFMINNDGYDNVELRHRLPPDEENLPIIMEFPQGNVLGIAKAALPVVVKLTVQRPQSFTVELEFMDENGTRYKMLLSGACDRSILTLQPFLGCNSWRPEGRTDEAAIRLQSDMDYDMPTGSFKVAMPELPKLFTVYINHTALKGPYQDLLNECIASRGKVLIDLMEAFSGRTVSGKTHSFSSDPAKAAPQIYEQYCSILSFLQRHGALVNLVHPEQMMASSELLQLLSTKSGQARGIRQNGRLWQKVVTDCDWEPTVKHAWVYIFFQFMKTFVFQRIDIATMRTLPGTDWTQQPELQNRVNSNVYSIPECICLNWLTFHLRKVLPQGPREVNNYTSDLEDGLALCAVLVSHWPALSDQQSQLNTQPSQLSDRESNAKVFISMLEALQCPFQVEESDIVTPNQCNMLCLVAYLYSWLPQLIPVSSVIFSGKLQEEQTRQVAMTNPSNKTLSYSVRLQGHPDFSIPSQLLTLEPNGTSHCVVTCKPTAGRPQASHLIFTSRKDGAALGRTMVLKLESEVLTDAPLKKIRTEKPQYEMKIFEFILVNPFLADCEFHITLHPIEPDAPTKTLDAPKKGKQKKQVPPEVEDRSIYPHPFGIFKTVVKLAKHAEEKIRAAFLPFTSGVHCCTVKFSDREHGSFCYELEGQALPPSICAENEFVMDLNRPVSAYLQLSATNQQLEAAKKAFMEGHPSAKKKELVQMLNALKPSVGRIPHYLSDLNQDDDNAIKLDLKPIGIGIYPDRIMLTSVQDVRLHDVEIHVKELEHTFTLAFGAQLKSSVNQQIPVFNSNAEKPVTVVAEFTAKTEEARKAFEGPHEVSVPVATPSFYPLVFTPPRIGRFKACLTLSVAATQEKWTYNLEAVGQEPPATEHIMFKCPAGSSKPLKLSVSNPLDTTVQYAVFTDIACMQGAESIEVPPNGSAEYNLCLRPMFPGLLMGLVSFSTSVGQLQWYTFEVDVTEAPKIDTIYVQTAVGGAKEIEVQVCNPSDKKVELTAIYGHINLVGPASIQLEARQEDCFKFYFSPVEAADCTTRFTLRNQQLGEFWYEVRMSTTQ